MVLTLHSGTVEINRSLLRNNQDPRSHLSLRESTRSPWEYKSSGSVSVSSSVGSHGTLDHVVGSTWVALVQPPACVVVPPPLAPASGVGADAVGCLTGAAELGVHVVGTSLPVCLLVATMISLFQSNFAKSLKKRDCRGFASPTSGSFQSHFGSLLLTGSRPEFPGRAPKKRTSVVCGVRACVVRVRRCVGGGRMSGLQKLSWGFLRLVALLPTLSPPGSLY